MRGLGFGSALGDLKQAIWQAFNRFAPKFARHNLLYGVVKSQMDVVGRPHSVRTRIAALRPLSDQPQTTAGITPNRRRAIGNRPRQVSRYFDPRVAEREKDCPRETLRGQC
jgi:hypothetical protein